MSRSKSNNYGVSLFGLTGWFASKREPSKLSRPLTAPVLPSGLLARSEFTLIPTQKEKSMQRETSNNRLAAPLNFQAVNVSSELPLESISFLQDDLSAHLAFTAAPIAAPHSDAQEIQIVPMGSQAPLQNLIEEIAAPETSKEENKDNVGDRHEPQLLTWHSESGNALDQIETPAHRLWDDKGCDALFPVPATGDDLATAAALVAIPEAPGMMEIQEEQTHAAANENTGSEEQMGALLEFTAEDLEAPPVLPVVITEEKSSATTLLSFHGLRQQPFDVTPDPSYLYFSASHREALTSISEGVENFRGFMALIAEPGMGKTTLLNKLMEELSATARVVFLFQTQCTSSELLAFFLNELEVDHTGMDVVAMHRALNQVLLEEMLRGRRFVLIVDEAQNLQDSVLETIRLLSDFETAHSKLIQIVLAGQPQLADTLLRPSLVQLRQRIAILSSLQALDPLETVQYIEHRLRAAGWNGHLIFTPEALELIAKLSAGVPRTINNLCFNALHKAFTRRQEIIDSGIVKEVSGKLNLEGIARRSEKITALPISVPAPVERYDRSGAAELAQAISEAIAAAVRPIPEPEPVAMPQPKPGVVVTGKLIEKIISQGWSKKHEFRLDVSFERDPIPGIPAADRHYCCNFYIGEEDAAGLQVGKPVRIRIEQE